MKGDFVEGQKQKQWWRKHFNGPFHWNDLQNQNDVHD